MAHYSTFTRDNCEVCNSQKSLHVHHKNSQKHFPEQGDLEENCVTLCQDCHITYHTVWNNGFTEGATEEDWELFLTTIKRFTERNQTKDALEFGNYVFSLSKGYYRE